MIVAGFVLVAAALVSLVLVVVGAAPLQVAYGVLAACLAGAALIGAGIVRNRPRHTGVTPGDGASWSGASDPGDGAGET